MLTPPLIADKDVPKQYQTYIDSLDIDGSGYISLTAVHRLLSTFGLSATSVERVRTRTLFAISSVQELIGPALP
jgi:hypothetical protein